MTPRRAFAAALVAAWAIDVVTKVWAAASLTERTIGLLGGRLLLRGEPHGPRSLGLDARAAGDLERPSVRQLVPGVWTWLQSFAHVVFYLVVLHAAYFLYMHYTMSFHRSVPPEANWFRVPLLVLAGILLALQIASSVKGARQRSRALRA